MNWNSWSFHPVLVMSGFMVWLYNNVSMILMGGVLGVESSAAFKDQSCSSSGHKAAAWTEEPWSIFRGLLARPEKSELLHEYIQCEYIGVRYHTVCDCVLIPKKKKNYWRQKMKQGKKILKHARERTKANKERKVKMRGSESNKHTMLWLSSSGNEGNVSLHTCMDQHMDH